MLTVSLKETERGREQERDREWDRQMGESDREKVKEGKFFIMVIF